MPKKIANKDLPPADSVTGAEALIARVTAARGTLAKRTDAGADAAKIRAARKALKRGQRKLRKERIRTALGKKATPAAASS